jgi:hypothetical protein
VDIRSLMHYTMLTHMIVDKPDAIPFLIIDRSTI